MLKTDEFYYILTLNACRIALGASRKAQEALLLTYMVELCLTLSQFAVQSL